jgi:nitrate/TMAO reductase-like tetraheme cytochrome c subunit
MKELKVQNKVVFKNPKTPRAKCPLCHTTKTWKCGTNMKRKNGLPFEKQMWRCKIGGKSFITSKTRFVQKNSQGGNICHK